MPGPPCRAIQPSRMSGVRATGGSEDGPNLPCCCPRLNVAMDMGGAINRPTRNFRRRCREETTPLPWKKLWAPPLCPPSPLAPFASHVLVPVLFLPLDTPSVPPLSAIHPAASPMPSLASSRNSPEMMKTRSHQTRAARTPRHGFVTPVPLHVFLLHLPLPNHQTLTST